MMKNSITQLRVLSILLLLILLAGSFAFVPMTYAKASTTSSSSASATSQVQTPPWLLNLLRQHQSMVSTGSPVGKGAIPTAINLGPTQTAANSVYYSPSEIRSIYDTTPLLNHGIDGTGETISIVDAFGDPYIQSELDSFSAAFGLPMTTVHIVCVDGPCDFSQGITTGWNGEIALDVEWAHAIAPGAIINLYIGSTNAQPLDDAVAAAVAGTNGNGTYVSPSSIISMSWGAPENDFGESGAIAPVFGENYPWINEVFQQGTAQGITFFASTGDWGANVQGFGQTLPYGGILYPSTDPFVTAVGGTSLYMSTTSGYLQYPPANATGSYGYETGWSWNNYRGWSSGGGCSSFFARPTWQTGPGVPSGNTRCAADVAWDGDPETGVLVFLSGTFYIFGGTSVGSPSWAGSMALIDQAAGHNLGFINPSLYAIMNNPSAYTKAFHDVTVGDIDPLQAGPGWDPVTGMGTPDIAALAYYLSHPSPSLSITASSSVALGTSASYAPVHIYATVTKGSTPVTSGTMSAKIISNTTELLGSIPMFYNPVTKQWAGTYHIKPTDPPGMWTAVVSMTSGPLSGTGYTTFSVGDGVTIFATWGFFLVGSQIPIEAVVLSPDESSIIGTGHFTATFYLGTPDGPVQGKLPLAFNSADEAWEGVFTVPPGVKQGPWVLSITGADTNGNRAAEAYSWVNIGLVASTFTDSPTYLLGDTIVIGSAICPTVCAASTVTTGSYKATIWAFGPSESGGTNIGTAPLTYDSTSGLWLGTFSITSSDPVGFYRIVVTGNDGLGDFALGETLVRVAPLLMNMVTTISKPTVVVGSTIVETLTARVTYPNGTLMKIGSVEAFTTYGHTRLTYHAASGRFVGQIALPTTAGSYPFSIIAYDPLGNAGEGAVSLTVLPVHSVTKLACFNAIQVGATKTCTATVTGYFPTGTITFSQTGTGSVTFSSSTCTLDSSGTCSVTVTGAKAGPVTITATYGGDTNNLGSFGSHKLTVYK
jgi:hypothetical protein